MRGNCFFVSGVSVIVLIAAGAGLAPTAWAVSSGLSAVARNAAARQPFVVLAQARGAGLSATDVKGESGGSVALSIRSARDATENDLYAISGLPEEAKLSAGGRRNQIWIVKQKDIQSLAVVTPKGYAGTFRVLVTRAEAPTRPVETCVFMVSISDETQVSTSAITPAPARPEKPAQLTPHIRTTDEQMLFERAMAQLKNADVAGARSILEYLASKGDAGAAFALGESYDPNVLARMFVKGVTPDEAKAREWYGKAQQLGSAQAQARLDAIEGR